MAAAGAMKSSLSTRLAWVPTRARVARNHVRTGLSDGVVTESDDGSQKFWKNFRQLPAPVQRLAAKQYKLWAKEPGHPSLQF
jgi:hypothetical protein